MQTWETRRDLKQHQTHTERRADGEADALMTASGILEKTPPSGIENIILNNKADRGKGL